MTFEEWKVLEASKETKDLKLVANFERNNPATAREYAKRKQEEQKKIEDIMKIQDRDTRLRKLAKATYDPDFTARRRREQM